jgi:tetratricopeptide (TPR) repeat protein
MKAFLLSQAAWILLTGTSLAGQTTATEPSASNSLERPSFSSGLAALEAGEFERAALIFETLIDLDRASAPVFYNLSIAEAQAGRSGPALLAIERALLIDPLNRKYRLHRTHYREQVSASPRDPPWWQRAAGWLPGGLWATLASLGLWGGVAFFLLPRWLRRDADTSGTDALAAVFGVIGTCCVLACVAITDRYNDGFVLSEEVPLKLAPTSTSPVARTLFAGEQIELTGKLGRFYRVKAGGVDPSVGWVEKSAAAPLYPDRKLEPIDGS